MQCCPKLKEIGFSGNLDVRLPSPSASTILRVDAVPQRTITECIFNRLRKFKHLAIIEMDFHRRCDSPAYDRDGEMEDSLDAWRRGCIEVLKNSPSEDRKLIRWRVIGRTSRDYPRCDIHVLVGRGEMEVFPYTSL